MKQILLTVEEIGVILRQCDCSMVGARHDIEEPDEHMEVAKAQAWKVLHAMINADKVSEGIFPLYYAVSKTIMREWLREIK